jgi:hypothetical protein
VTKAKKAAIRSGWTFSSGGSGLGPRERARRLVDGRWFELAASDEKSLMHRIEQTEIAIERERLSSRPTVHVPPRIVQE